MNCRHCRQPLEHVFLDLGFAPPSNRYLRASDLTRPEIYLPLKLFVCDRCWLVQTEDVTGEADLFTADYAYFSSVSNSWLAHAEKYVRDATERFGLGGKSFVVEVASNDGYLLKNFVHAGVPCLGIEPTHSTAAAAERLGIPVVREFFGLALAQRLSAEGKRADLIVGNNVYAHVPDINDFTAGLAALLRPEGVVTLEFPHLMRLIESVQFDTVYHEHFSYLSLTAVRAIFERAGLRVFDVEELATHGGSLRVFGCLEASDRPTSTAVDRLLQRELEFGLTRLETFSAFQASISRLRDDLLVYLVEQRRAGRKVAAYGAAAKGNTLLNYAGVKPDLLSFVCDAAPSKQGMFMPGSHIPIVPPAALADARPHAVLVLPWNLRTELANQLEYVRAWGAELVIAVPRLTRI